MVWRVLLGVVLLVVGVLLGRTVLSSPGSTASPASDAAPVQGAVVIHPPLGESFTCSEHPEGQLTHLGDALGSDCLITRLDGWSRFHEGEGRENEDWFGWDRPVLAPFDGVVEVIRINRNGTNRPGRSSEGPATSIVFARDDGVQVMLAHLRGIEVSEGDRVSAGQRVARVGNNGHSRSPHIHIGAWKGETPLQIRMDLTALGRLRGYLDPVR